MNFLTQIFGGAGAALIGTDIEQVTNYAEIAYGIIAGELLIIILLLAAVLIWGVAVA